MRNENEELNWGTKMRNQNEEQKVRNKNEQQNWGTKMRNKIEEQKLLGTPWHQVVRIHQFLFNWFLFNWFLFCFLFPYDLFALTLGWSPPPDIRGVLTNFYSTLFFSDFYSTFYSADFYSTFYSTMTFLHLNLDGPCNLMSKTLTNFYSAGFYSAFCSAVTLLHFHLDHPHRKMRNKNEEQKFVGIPRHQVVGIHQFLLHWFLLHWILFCFLFCYDLFALTLCWSPPPDIKGVLNNFYSTDFYSTDFYFTFCSTFYSTSDSTFYSTFYSSFYSAFYFAMTFLHLHLVGPYHLILVGSSKIFIPLFFCWFLFHFLFCWFLFCFLFHYDLFALKLGWSLQPNVRDPH